MRQPAAERPRPPLLAPSGISLAGRSVVYATVANRPERYWAILAELSALARGGEVVTAASIFGGGSYRTAAERIEAYYAKLGQVLGSGDVLVVLPADEGTIGVSLWNTMVVAQQRAADILVVTPTGHLRYLDQMTFEVLPEGRPYGEAARAWAKVHWRASRAFPRLSWAAPARDRVPEERPPAPAEEREREASIAAAAKTPKGAAKALARGRAAAVAASQAREAVLGRGGSPVEASAAANAASAAVMQRPLTEFMTPEQQAAAAADPRPAAPPRRRPPVPPPPAGAWSEGELKALRQVRRPTAQLRVLANLAKGKAAKTAASEARARAEAAGASAEEVEAATREASQRVLSRPLEEFLAELEQPSGDAR